MVAEQEHPTVKLATPQLSRLNAAQNHLKRIVLHLKKKLLRNEDKNPLRPKTNLKAKVLNAVKSPQKVKTNPKGTIPHLVVKSRRNPQKTPLTLHKLKEAHHPVLQVARILKHPHLLQAIPTIRFPQALILQKRQTRLLRSLPTRQLKMSHRNPTEWVCNLI